MTMVFPSRRNVELGGPYHTGVFWNSDAVIDDRPIGDHVARTVDGLTLAPWSSGTRFGYGMVFARTDEGLRAAVNRALAELRVGGERERMRAGDAMIARACHGVTPAGRADAYQDYLTRTGVRDYQATAGRDRVAALTGISPCGSAPPVITGR